MFEALSHVGAMELTFDKARRVAAGYVSDFRIGAFGLDARFLDSPRHTQLAVAATALALRDAGISLAEARKRRPLVAMAQPVAERQDIFSCQPEKASSMQTELLNFVCGTLAREQPNFVSSLDAIAFAAAQVSEGHADLAICGGADALTNASVLEDLRRLGLAAGHDRDCDRQCRPFDLWRSHGVLAEGACMFVLEAESSPRHPTGHVMGGGNARDPDGAPWSSFASALKLALGNAGKRPLQVDCIYADGVGQKELDSAEAKALENAFGDHLAEVPAVSIKGAVGNALGAAGAFQVGCAVLGMRHSIIASTVNWRHPDPACQLNLSPSVRMLATGTTLVLGRDPSGLVSALLLSP
ncbi:MAG: beta-ketoacyl synthase N-terminal-like domain-containing protein [Nibricoccus sp.]